MVVVGFPFRRSALYGSQVPAGTVTSALHCQADLPDVVLPDEGTVDCVGDFLCNPPCVNERGLAAFASANPSSFMAETVTSDTRRPCFETSMGSDSC